VPSSSPTKFQKAAPIFTSWAKVEEAERVWMRVRVESPVGVVGNTPPRECACIPSNPERRELPLLHLNALTAVRLRAFHFEVVVFAAMRLDREIDARCCGYLVAECAQKLLALIGVVWGGLATRELVDPLRDELARENG
jgi:hypothetical protein